MAATGTYSWNHSTANWTTAADWTASGGSTAFSTVASGANGLLFQLGANGGIPYTVTVNSSIFAGALNMSSADAFLAINNTGTLKSTAPAFATGAGATLMMSGGTISLGGTGAILSFVTITVNGGQIIGAGQITSPAAGAPSLSTSGTGKIIANGGILDVGGASSSYSMALSGSYQINNASTLFLDSNATLSLGTIDFTTSANMLELALNSGYYTATNVGSINHDTFNATLSNLAIGSSGLSPIGASVIDLNVTQAIVSASIINGNTLEAVTNGANYDFVTTGAFGSSVLNFGTIGGGLIANAIWLSTAPCYAEGSLILTERGEVPVECLVEGDQVVTLRDGVRQPMAIKWLGNRQIDLTRHPHPHLVAPIRIHKDAFGRGGPRRDLVVSPAHAIFVDGKLIPANLLINHMTIVQELNAKDVTYYHVELERHSVIFAEGLTSESYLDTGNRTMFANAGMAMVLHPEFHVNAGMKCWENDACAPLAVDAETIAPVWHSLAARAQSLGYTPPRLTTTMDADLHVLANGRRLRPVAAANGRYTFMVPAGMTSLSLESRTTAPIDLNPLSGDGRLLGVAVRSLTLRAGDEQTVVPADHPNLTQGWHTPETDGRSLWRWTNGSAHLPLNTETGPVMLDIDLGQTGTYILTRSETARRLAA